MSAKYTKEDILNELRTILVNDFEIGEDKIVPDANLFEDLEFDSIDAVDLAVRLQDFTKQKISPENFKQIRTINDVVEAVYGLLK
ncbi:MAG: acyl carrier protein [Clostridium sp.]|nr:acyl carrier protein [Clostridium sp.]